MPPASTAAEALFVRLTPSDPDILVRRMFGQPAAFCRGHMFLGVFGDDVFVRLDESGRTASGKVNGTGPFEPMPGRPMREYVVFPHRVWSDPKQARAWLDRSLRYVRSLPPKASKGR